MNPIKFNTERISFRLELSDFATAWKSILIIQGLCSKQQNVEDTMFWQYLVSRMAPTS